MSINVTGRVVKVKRSDNLRRISVKKGKIDALKYNHIRVQFADGSDRHLLFTDKQLQRARRRAKEKLQEETNITWIHEIWFEDFLTFDHKEVLEIIKDKELPKIAKLFNHVRINCEGEDMHFLLTDSEIRVALERVDNVLPKISWLTTSFK